MALINCEECGHEISESAKSCPQCGYTAYNFWETLGDASYAIAFVIFGITSIFYYIGGFPIGLSITLLGLCFLTFLSKIYLNDPDFIESTLPTKELRQNFSFYRKATIVIELMYVYLLVLSSIYVYVVIILILLSFYYYFMDFGYLYDAIYEFKEELLGGFLVLPLVTVAWNNLILYLSHLITLKFFPDSSPDEIPTNPYAPLEDKNLLIQNIIEITGKNSWKAELEKLDVDTLNTFLEKLSRGENLDK
ncbi:zinc ribbon domain-containing protein [Gammaproteobacteria bacterium]|nr:zinc ribbon domain-containing protein [Gammaproteobacteria bacterium]